jgi:hypothetical protein
MAEPCGAASQIFGIHAGVDGVEQGGAIGVGECDQLRRGEFVGFGEHGGGQRNSEECQQKPNRSSLAYMAGRLFGFGKEHGRLLASVLAVLVGPSRLIISPRQAVTSKLPEQKNSILFGS